MMVDQTAADQTAEDQETSGNAVSDVEGAKQEAKEVAALSTEYNAARKFDEDARKGYEIDRSFASGAALKRWYSSANLIGSFIDILVSFLYAKDPAVSAKAAKHVGGSSQDNVDFAETLGIVIPHLWKKARLKKAMRKMLRSSLSVGPGWLKVIMTHETRTDPIVKKKLNDLEDNIAELNAKQTLLDEEDLTEDETDVKMAEMRQLQTSLNAKLEVAHRFGLAVDFVQADDMQVSLDVADTSDHLDADWNANVIYIPTSKIRTRFPRLTKKDAEQAEKYYQRKVTKPTNDETEVDMGYTAKDHGRYSKDASGEDNEVTFAAVVELWDNRDNHIKTFIKGVPRWAIEPYTPPYASSRFFPYFQLALFEVDGERHPQSLSGRLRQLQDEYSGKRSSSRLTSERSVPGTIFNRQGITPADVRKIEQSTEQEFIGLDPTTGDDIRKLFSEKPVAKIDPAVFSTGPVLSDMERVAGIQEALSQSVATPKTATEAKIQQTGFTSRTGADRDTIEDVVQDIAFYTAELSVQALPAEVVARLAGEKAFWPAGMDVEDLLTMAEVEIEAGTTGKPDDESLRQSWSVLLPLVQQGMTTIQEAQLTGNLPMAEAIKNLIRETMRRLDERIDIDQFIPEALPALPTAESVAGQAAAAQGGAPTGPEGAAAASAEANTLV